MAVSVISAPQLYSPAYNSIVWTVNSSNKAQCNFRYRCDVYVNTVLVASLPMYPTGPNGYAEFKINRVIQDYLSYNLQNNLYGFAENDASICRYVLKFGEEYDNSVDCDAGTTIYSDLTTTASYFAWNAAMQYREFEEFDYDTFVMDDSAAKFLTHSPSEVLIGEGQQFAINFFNITNNKVYALVVDTYDSSGTPIQSCEIQNTAYYSVAAGDTSRRMLSVGVGTDNLNNSTLLSGNQPVITADVAYYKIYLEDSLANVISEVKRFTIDRRYTKYGVNRFWWLNRLGGFDAYSFTKLSNRTTGITRTEYHKLMGALDTSASPDVWKYSIGDRGRTNISIDAQDRFKTNSHWLTEDEALWMEELFTSLEPYLIDTFHQNCDNLTDFDCSDGDPSYLILYVSDVSLYSIGDSVYVEFVNDVMGYNGIHTVLTVGSNFIIIDQLCDAEEEPELRTGQVYLLGFDAELDPIIITSAAWEEKLKSSIKNIQYLIDVDKAYKINIQRN